MKCSKCNNEISDNSIYCNLCGADQRYNKEKSKLHTQSTSTSPKIPSTIFIILLTLFMIVFFANSVRSSSNGISGSNSSKNSSNYSSNDTSSSSSNTSSYTLSLDGERVVCATTKSYFDTFFEYVGTSDIDAINNMLDRGELFFSPAGTSIELLDYGLASCKVKILEGIYTNEICYVVTEAVHSN